MSERWERRYGRRVARQHWHKTPWRTCYSVMGGFCLPCFFRKMTGVHKRERLAAIARMNERAAIGIVSPHQFRIDAEGNWRPITQDTGEQA